MRVLDPDGRGGAAGAGDGDLARGAPGFRFLLGTWHTHYRILRRRLAHSHDWYDCYGTSVVRPFWNGSANLEDGDLPCPNRYIGGMTLRLYSANTHQWSLWWGTRKLGLVPPPQVGHFEDGVGYFYARDTYNGTPVIVRFRWNEPDPGRPRFEQTTQTLVKKKSLDVSTEEIADSIQGRIVRKL